MRSSRPAGSGGACRCNKAVSLMTDTGDDNQQRDGSPETQSQLLSEEERVAPKSWPYSPDAWRWAQRLDVRYVDMLFRTRTARVLPRSARARLIESGIPPDIVDETLGRIRRADQWSNQWIETAQRYLGDSRRQTSALNIREAAQARQTAAMCYHVAQIFEIFDRQTLITCRSAAASLFTQTLPHLHPNARHMWVPWRSTSLPAYFQVPDPISDPVGLVVILNGTSMSKEETFTWHGRFLEQGYAVMSLDSPGTGEATGIAGVDVDQDDILDGIFAIFEHEPIIDLRRVVVLGPSLGGNQAVRVAAHDRRVMASVAITPPYDPKRWITRASPLLIRELEFMIGEESVNEIRDHISDFSLEQAAVTGQHPMLVFGGGRDVLVPPNEAQILAERVGERATLVWYPKGGHCLFENVDQWAFEAATWIQAVGDIRRDPDFAQDPFRTSALAREALESTSYQPQKQVISDEDDPGFTEYARLVTDTPQEDQD